MVGGSSEQKLVVVNDVSWWIVVASIGLKGRPDLNALLLLNVSLESRVKSIATTAFVTEHQLKPPFTATTITSQPTTTTTNHSGRATAREPLGSLQT